MQLIYQGIILSLQELQLSRYSKVRNPKYWVNNNPLNHQRKLRKLWNQSDNPQSRLRMRIIQLRHSWSRYPKLVRIIILRISNCLNIISGIWIRILMNFQKQNIYCQEPKLRNYRENLKHVIMMLDLNIFKRKRPKQCTI